MAAKKYFEEVDTKINFPELEQSILQDWGKSGLVKKYLQKNNNSKKYYSFLDGPITANNPMGVHHAWGRTYKDLWQRYYNMKGYKQRFQNGFDCQGLWVEVEVEKELGLHSKKDIENLVPGDKSASIAKFVELCKERVFKYADIQTEQSKRLGYFMDWENSYFTLSDDNNYMIWHFLKTCHEKGLIYKGHDSVPWCPRCGTAISQHEMLTEDYRELVHDSLFVNYQINDREKEYLVIWTTTPWTLPGNVAAAVNTEMEYVQAESEGKKYYMSEKSAKSLGFNVVKKLKGSELVGLTYTSAFDDIDRVSTILKGYTHRVIASDERLLPVSDEEGTGVVHVATGCGTEDFAIGKKEKLPVIDLIDEEANYLSGLGELSQKNAKKHPDIIIEYLTKSGNLLKVEKYKHRYPACWRCKTELVWRVVDEWYIAIDPVRNDMKNVTKKINWTPKFGEKRELDWLENMDDWLISKKRYWGLALPIWECEKCGNFEVIGGKEELKEKAVSGWDEFDGHTPHKPYVDEIKLKCSKCGSSMARIPDVGNPWLDAGIVSFSTISKDNQSEPLYISDKNEFAKWFPADFITESFPGQFKNWFYSLLAMSTVLENKEPFKNVLGFATLLAEDGRPMHKSWGNAIEFNEGAEKIGVDVMRWMYARQNPSDNLLFGYRLADETRRQFHLKLWNVYNFFVTYANNVGWSPKKSSKSSGNILDKWILARLAETLTKVEAFLNSYDVYSASQLLETFLDDLSNWYVRRSRERASNMGSTKNQNEFFDTCFKTLEIFVKILAPITPFISENIYANLAKNGSVHLADWPKTDLKVDRALIEDMNLVREIAEKAHALRKEKAIPVRQPLSEVVVSTINKKPADEFLLLLSEEINVKKVLWRVHKTESVVLNTKITPELAEEASLRELIRKIQEERKNKGVRLDQKIIVRNSWIPKGTELLEKLLQTTLASKIEKGEFSIKVEK